MRSNTDFSCAALLGVRKITSAFALSTSLVAWWSELLTTNHEVPGSIPGSTMGIFLVGGGSPW